MRDRLIELIQQADAVCSSRKQCEGCAGFGKGADCVDHHIADHLLASGVIVPPCKVGQTVWYVDKWAERVKPIKVISYEICNNGEEEFGCWGGDFTPTRFHVENNGKTVFLTREEAEQALLKP